MKGREMCAARNANAFGKERRIVVLAIVACLLGALTIGGTLAFLTTNTDLLENKFTPSIVSCEVEEEFDGRVKTNINVKNTGNTAVYLRVKLVSYRVNDDEERIGGKADIPSFMPGEGWVKEGEYYYYNTPVEPNARPAANLANSIELTGTYNDADGGKQVIEVMAEAIQSEPANAVNAAWRFTPGGSGN